MTTHTPQELLEAWKDKKVPVYRDGLPIQLYGSSTIYQTLDTYEKFIKHPEQFTLTDPNTKKEPMPRYFTRYDIANMSPEEFKRHEAEIDHAFSCGRIIGTNDIYWPETTGRDITEPEPRRPQVGQRLTMELFTDDVFMRRVKRVEWVSGDGFTYAVQEQFYGDRASAIQNALQRGWEVTITEVMSG